MSTATTQKFASYSKTIGATLLVCGTSIGGGMLALPVVTAPSGFFPSLLLFVLSWAVMTFTSLLMLECHLSIRGSSELASISRKILGPWGEGVAWGTYLLLLYALMAAYITGTCSLVESAFFAVFRTSIPLIPTQLSLILATGWSVIYGIKVIDKINRLFVLGAGVCFLFLVFFLSSQIDFLQLLRVQPASAPYALPVVVTSFGFHIVIPVIIRYLDRNARSLRLSLLIGSLIPLVIYITWQLIVLGSIPFDGKYSLSAVVADNNQISALIHVISYKAKNAIVIPVSLLFCGFAILTSLFGVSLSLWEFFKEKFASSHRRVSNKISLGFMTFLPPLALILWLPHAFTDLLAYAGIFVSILLGLLPIAICWKGRQRGWWGKEYTAFGGKTALWVAALFFLCVISLTLIQ